MQRLGVGWWEVKKLLIHIIQNAVRLEVKRVNVSLNKANNILLHLLATPALICTHIPGGKKNKCCELFDLSKES